MWRSLRHIFLKFSVVVMADRQKLSLMGEFVLKSLKTVIMIEQTSM